MRTHILPLVTVGVVWAATASHGADSVADVAVSGGKIRGSLASDDGAVFKGIPSAQPPTGELRWREPMPVKTWEGVRDATAFGAPCMQGSGNSSEDCLYLNIWTPE
jgi:para-nitrobenzyl esterase